MSLKRFLKRVKEIEQEQDNPFERRNQTQNELPSPQHDESNWLVSYADMMTLLCAFFVMMFSMAKLNVPEYDKIRKQLSEQFGGEYVDPTKDLARFATQMINDLGIEKEASVIQDRSGVAIVFESTLFFETLSAHILEPGVKILEKLTTAILDRQTLEKKSYKIVIEGHTDSRPVVGGAYPTNWELSSARASRVVRLFLDKGFLPSHLLAIGYGETRLQAPDRLPSGEWNAEALAKNRRVVVRILEPEVDTVPWNSAGKNFPAVTTH